MRLAAMLERYRAPDPTLAAPGANPGANPDGNPGVNPGVNPVAARLASIPDERLRQLGAMLKERIDEREIDAQDALLLRLLLDEYSTAVRQLRAVTEVIDQRLNAARMTIAAGRRAIASERAGDH